MFLLQNTIARNIAELLESLEGKYFVAEGLTVSFANRNILPKGIAKINHSYEKLMLECQSLGENDKLPDYNDATKSRVIKAKRWF